MWKKCNVIMLPTVIEPYKMPYSKYIPKSELVLGLENSLKYDTKLRYISDSGSISNYSKEMYQHLYITSDNEIEESDWVYENNLSNERIFQVYKRNNKLGIFRFINVFIPLERSSCKKIIASTDKSLNLPSIPQSFIEQYITSYNKGNKIEDVMMEYETGVKKNGIQELMKDEFYQRFPEELPNCVFEEKPKINLDNTISIKESKSSWSREEVIELIRKYESDNHFQSETSQLPDSWISKNL